MYTSRLSSLQLTLPPAFLTVAFFRSHLLPAPFPNCLLASLPVGREAVPGAALVTSGLFVSRTHRPRLSFSSETAVIIRYPYQ